MYRVGSGCHFAFFPRILHEFSVPIGADFIELIQTINVEELVSRKSMPKDIKENGKVFLCP